MATGAEPAREQLPAPAVADGDFLRLGVEEEFHVVDLASRELVAQAPTSPRGSARRDLLRRAPAQRGGDQLAGLHGPRRAPCGSRRSRPAAAVEAAAGRARRRGRRHGPAGRPRLRLAVTPSVRYERMLADYQLLVREQLICGAQVHVGVVRPGPRGGDRPAGHPAAAGPAGALGQLAVLDGRGHRLRQHRAR